MGVMKYCLLLLLVLLSDKNKYTYSPELNFTVTEHPKFTDPSGTECEMPHTVGYNNIHNLGLKAIQELSAENTTLKSQVENTMARIQALEKR